MQDEATGPTKAAEHGTVMNPQTAHIVSSSFCRGRISVVDVLLPLQIGSAGQAAEQAALQQQKMGLISTQDAPAAEVLQLSPSMDLWLPHSNQQFRLSQATI
jgi:hypothetical protein